MKNTVPGSWFPGTGTRYEQVAVILLKVAAFEPLARGRVNKIILSQTNQTHTFQIKVNMYNAQQSFHQYTPFPYAYIQSSDKVGV